MFNWINPKEFDFNSFLLMDRWMIAMIILNTHQETFQKNLGIALAYHKAVAWYCVQKAPECKEKVESLIEKAPQDLNEEQVREAVEKVLDHIDWAVVLVHPEMMNEACPYIKYWQKERLFELADFTDKLVLDVGSGTGRLAFAAAEKARMVYASEPVDQLREYMRDKIKREQIKNVRVVDGFVEHLPYEDSTFDIVMSAHVVGDFVDQEMAELERVVKSGGYILDCVGESDFKDRPNPDFLRHGFDYSTYKSVLGGDVIRYWKQVIK